MARFHFRAVSGTGEVVEGELEAHSQAAVVEQLRGQGHLPLAAEPVGASDGRRRCASGCASPCWAADACAAAVAVMTHPSWPRRSMPA